VKTGWVDLIADVSGAIHYVAICDADPIWTRGFEIRTEDFALSFFPACRYYETREANQGTTYLKRA
jgi:hypothetical protein